MRQSPVIGFISPPAWFDPAPAEFPTAVAEAVRTQQAPLALPEFDYALSSIAAAGNALTRAAHALGEAGCSLVAQVGSPFSWAGINSEAEARQRCDAIAIAAGVPAVMTGLAIVDALRALGLQRPAATCTYYNSDWRDAFAAFLACCGFGDIPIQTLVEQGLVESDDSLMSYGWRMSDDLTRRSVEAIAEAAPDADAIVLTGSGARTLHLLQQLETLAGRPVIAADTALYWAAARQLDLQLCPAMASLAKSPRGASGT